MQAGKEGRKEGGKERGWEGEDVREETFSEGKAGQEGKGWRSSKKGTKKHENNNDVRKGERER